MRERGGEGKERKVGREGEREGGERVREEGGGRKKGGEREREGKGER